MVLSKSGVALGANIELLPRKNSVLPYPRVPQGGVILLALIGETYRRI
jgi:hypothetical protein